MRIIITGPESSGKSTLSSDLSRFFSLPLVEEYSRTYLGKLDRPYNPSDLINMARGQLDIESEAIEESKIIVCDTSTEVYWVWYDYKYGHPPKELREMLNINSPDFYLLLKPNIPWAFDPLRENPHDRDELFEKYQNLLEENNARYEIVKGIDDQRTEEAKEIISTVLRQELNQG